jgi:phage-related protein
MVHAAVHGSKKLPAIFFRTDIGTEPVRDWLTSTKLTNDDRRLIGRDIAKVEFGWPVGMPTCEPLGYGLFEVRTDLPQNRITRVIFCIQDGCMVLLHGFIKKATDGKKTPRREIDKAHDRRDDLKRRVAQ